MTRRRLFGLFSSLPFVAKLLGALPPAPPPPIQITRIPDPYPVYPELPELEWHGDTGQHDALFLLVSNPAPPAADSAMGKALLHFFWGEQWDAEVRHERELKGRPCLVLNHLPAIAEAMLARSPHQLTAELKTALLLVVTMRNIDAQREYNYMASARAEILRTALTEFVFDGHRFISPPIG